MESLTQCCYDRPATHGDIAFEGRPVLAEGLRRPTGDGQMSYRGWKRQIIDLHMDPGAKSSKYSFQFNGSVSDMTDNSSSIELSIGNVSLSVSGSEEFVKEQFHKIHETHSFAELEVPEPDVGAEDQEQEAGEDTSEEEAEEGDGEGQQTLGDSGPDIDKSINEILADSEISTAKDKALLVGWYLDVVRDNGDFTTPEVEDEGRRSRVDLGENVGRDVRSNVSEGYLGAGEERDGDDTYWVTGSGLDYLDEKGVPAR